VAFYQIVAGTNNRLCPNDECEQRGVTAATRHSEFQNSGIRGFPNDISVIEFDAPINQVAGSIQYATLATTTDQVGRTCYISGWGRISDGGLLPVQLQEAVIDLLTTAECADMWAPTPVTDSQVCIYDRATQARGACNGDSGGPLVCQLPGGGWELVGATSWGRTGCSTDFASVYTRISFYNSWILDAIGE
jgi:secreted trypsin-like serine protease